MLRENQSIMIFAFSVLLGCSQPEVLSERTKISGLEGGVDRSSEVSVFGFAALDLPSIDESELAVVNFLSGNEFHLANAKGSSWKIDAAKSSELESQKLPFSQADLSSYFMADRELWQISSGAIARSSGPVNPMTGSVLITDIQAKQIALPEFFQTAVNPVVLSVRATHLIGSNDKGAVVFVYENEHIKPHEFEMPSQFGKVVGAGSREDVIWVLSENGTLGIIAPDKSDSWSWQQIPLDLSFPEKVKIKAIDFNLMQSGATYSVEAPIAAITNKGLFISQQADSGEGAGTFQKSVLPLVKKYCQGCHVDKTDEENFLKDKDLNSKVTAVENQQASYTMPPANSAEQAKMTDSERDIIVEWLKRQ